MRSKRTFAMLFAVLVTSSGVGLAAVSYFVPSLVVPWTIWRLDHDILFAAGVALTILGLLLSLATVQLGLMVTTFTVVVFSLFAVVARPPQKGDVEFRINGRSGVWASRYDLRDMNTIPDDRYGYRGEPGVRARQFCLDFAVTYTHDKDGWRIMPEPTGPAPHPEIVFLGCSFTYGIGVEDDESFSAVLAREAWTGCKVRNLSFSGWGTTHVCLVLEDELKNNKPACVIYCYTPAHLQRNNLRASWHQKYPHQKIPKFDNNGEFLGLVKASEATLPDTPETAEQEIRVTRAVLRKMSEMCRAKGVPFFAVQIQEADPRVSKRVLDISGMTVIDVSDGADEQFYNDGHFTRGTNRVIANALASNAKLAEVTALPQLYVPEKVKPVPASPTGWRARLGGKNAGETIELKPDLNSAGRFRVESIHHLREIPKPTEIVRRFFPLAAGQAYTMTFKAKADVPRPMEVFIERRTVPNTIGGLWAKLTMMSTWRNYRFEFVSKDDMPRTNLVISLKKDDTPFDIADLKFEASPPVKPGDFHVLAFPKGSGHGAVARPRAEDPSVLRVDQISTFERVPWHLQLARESYMLRKGEKYRVDGEVRAEALRKLDLTLLSGSTPFQPLGLVIPIHVGPQWRPIHAEFVAAADSDDATLLFRFGDSDIPFEIRGFELSQDGKVLEPREKVVKPTPSATP